MELGAELGSSVAGVYLGDFWGGGCAVGLGWWCSVQGLTVATSKEGSGSVGWRIWAWVGMVMARSMTIFLRLAEVELVVIYIAYHFFYFGARISGSRCVHPYAD